MQAHIYQRRALHHSVEVGDQILEASNAFIGDTEGPLEMQIGNSVAEAVFEGFRDWPGPLEGGAVVLWALWVEFDILGRSHMHSSQIWILQAVHQVLSNPLDFCRGICSQPSVWRRASLLD